MEEPVGLSDLPVELIEHVGSHLPSRQRASMRQIDRRSRDVFGEGYWERLVRLDYPDDYESKTYPWVSWAQYYDLLSIHPLLRPSVLRRVLAETMARKSYRLTDEAVFFLVTSLRPVAEAFDVTRTTLLRRMDVNRFNWARIVDDSTGIEFVKVVAAKLWLWCMSSTRPDDTYGVAGAVSKCRNPGNNSRLYPNFLFETVGFPRSLFEPKRSAVPKHVFDSVSKDGMTADARKLVEAVLHSFGTAGLWDSVVPSEVASAVNFLIDECRRLSGRLPIGTDVFLWVLRRNKVVGRVDVWGALEAADRVAYP